MIYSCAQCYKPVLIKCISRQFTQNLYENNIYLKHCIAKVYKLYFGYKTINMFSKFSITYSETQLPWILAWDCIKLFMVFLLKKVISLPSFPVHIFTEYEDIVVHWMAYLLLRIFPCKNLSKSLSLSLSTFLYLSFGHNVLDSCVRRVVLTLSYLLLKPQLCIYTFYACLFPFSIIE